MPQAENFLRRYLLRGPHAYKNVLLFERTEEPSLQPNGYPRVLYKCLLCKTGCMSKKQVQGHCNGTQHQTNYAALDTLLTHPSSPTPDSETEEPTESQQDDTLYRLC